MERKAIISTGEPREEDNKKKFYEALERDVSIMECLALGENYSIEKISSEEIVNYIDETSFKGDFLFYYTGHGKDGVFEGNELKPFLCRLDKVKGDKIIVFDSCMGIQRIGKFYMPKNTKLITANEVPLNNSLAKILWDWTSARGNLLWELNKNALDSMKQNWVYFKERGPV